MQNQRHQFPEEKHFSESLQTLERDMRQAKKQTDKFHQGFRARLESFGRDFERHLNEADQMVSKLAIAADLSDCARKASASFQQAAVNLRCQQDLRQQLQERFVIFVYGKVKCGKSSLGNLISQYVSGKPEFFKYAENGHEVAANRLEELPDGDEFAVKATEATATIQGFRLPGLSWLDSPGLDSVTRKNGELTEKYVAAADLVLFMAHADHPAREETLKKLAFLAKDGKRMVLILTRSDTTETDEVDGKIVSMLKAKSPANRKAQEENMTEQIRAHLGDNAQLVSGIFSVSKKIADMAHAEQSLTLWEQSNIGRLLSTIQDILSREAIQQKAKTPLEQMRASLNQLITGRDNQYTLENLRQTLGQTRCFLQQNQADFVKAFRMVEREMLDEAATLVDELFMDTTLAPEEKPQRLGQELNKALEEKMRHHVNPVIQRGAEGVRRALGMSINATLFTAEEQYVDVKVTRDRVNTGTAVGAALGSAIGALGFFAGPVGWVTMTAGSMIGGAIGKKMGRASIETEHVRLKAGDDSAAKLRQLRRETQKQIKDFLAGQRQNLEAALYSASLQKISLLEQEIVRFTATMTQFIEKGA